MTELPMPRLGADMESATLVAWQKRPGDRVRRGETVAEIETDKGIIEIEAFVDGLLEQILVPVGQKVPVGTILALIEEEGAAPPGQPPAAVAVPSNRMQTDAAQPPRTVMVEAPHAEHVDDRVPMSPSARRLARELGVDPRQVHGTGRHGAISREDVERAAAAQSAAASVPPPGEARPAPSPTWAEQPARMRQAIGAAMARSKREIPHYYLATTIDLQPALNWLAEENLRRPVTERLLYGVLLLKAVALALREVPELNAVWEEGEVVSKTAVHVGVAISLRQGGLIAPAIHDTDQKDLGQLMREFRDVVGRARAGGLKSSELADPTITVTSLGEQGVEAVFGVIYPPQVAIVGFGKVVERPWSIGGGLMSRKVITATLSADHRVSDGHRGGLFLAAVDRLLQEPEKL